MKQVWIDIKPFFSVVIFIATIFCLVLFKMENRRMGYSVLKAIKEVQMLKDQNRMLSMEYARLTRPEHVKKYAMSRLTMNDARNGQIIQLTGQKIALPQ
jgi:cell division protein FtsL